MFNRSCTTIARLLLEVFNCCPFIRLQFDQILAFVDAVRMEERSPLAVEIIANKQDIFRIILLVAAGDAAVVQLNLNRSPYSPKGPCADKIVTLQLQSEARAFEFSRLRDGHRKRFSKSFLC